MSLPIRALEVVARSVKYKNLTAASQNVGLSQPQLSRLVAQLEEELDVILLDRTSKRKATWTPLAFKLSETFEKSQAQLERSVLDLHKESLPSVIWAACLEGLSDVAVEHMSHLANEESVTEIHLEVLDQDELVRRFTDGMLDLVWTFVIPGKAKPKYIEELGFQVVKEESSGKSDMRIMSSYELGKAKRRPDKKNRVFVSNSLAVRKLWYSKEGGRGRFPSPVMKSKGNTTQTEPVLLIGSEQLHHRIWDAITKR